MFDRKKFEITLFELGISKTELAKKLGISTVTLYRKMSGESDFFRNEIQIIRSLIGVDRAEAIFFASKVS
jgi:predicted transcriptional regulator